MKKLLKSNIWIDGFDSYNEINRIDAIIGHKHIYLGKTNEIPEELGSQYCDWMFWDEKPERKDIIIME